MRSRTTTGVAGGREVRYLCAVPECFGLNDVRDPVHEPIGARDLECVLTHRITTVGHTRDDRGSLTYVVHGHLRPGGQAQE